MVSKERKINFVKRWEKKVVPEQIVFIDKNDWKPKGWYKRFPDQMYRHAIWLFTFTKNLHYRYLVVNDKRISPKVTYNVVVEFWKVFWEHMWKHKVVRLPILGDFFLGEEIRTNVNGEDYVHYSLVWGNKFNPKVKAVLPRYFIQNYIQKCPT